MFDQLSSILIGPKATIRDALAAIDAGSVEIALMVDEQEMLLGTVTDGDIRRALLSGADLGDLVDPYIAHEPKVVDVEASRVDVLDLMRARRLSQIPVVDDSGRLLGLHVMQELLGAVERPNWAVIMAGGRGSRLGSLTEDIPKPMLKVAGRPILERIVLHLVGSGIRTIFISVNYLGDVIEKHFGDGSGFGCKIEYLREEKPLGTAGSLGLLQATAFTPTSPVLVMNGDLLTDFSVNELLTTHVEADAIATVAVREHAHAVPFGVVAMEGDRLVGVAEKPVATWLINAGIYVLEPKLIARVSPNEPLALTDLLQSAVEAGERVAVWHTTDDWHDIGQPADLRRARGEL